MAGPRPPSWPRERAKDHHRARFDQIDTQQAGRQSRGDRGASSKPQVEESETSTANFAPLSPDVFEKPCMAIQPKTDSLRWAIKKSDSIDAHSSARTPARTSGR